MSDRVDERILLFVTPDFPDQEERIQHDAADQHRPQQDAQEEQNPSTPTEENPADVNEDDDGNQARAEGDEEPDRRAPSSNYHDSSLRERRSLRVYRGED